MDEFKFKTFFIGLIAGIIISLLALIIYTQGDFYNDGENLDITLKNISLIHITKSIPTCVNIIETKGYYEPSNPKINTYNWTQIITYPSPLTKREYGVSDRDYLVKVCKSLNSTHCFNDAMNVETILKQYNETEGLREFIITTRKCTDEYGATTMGVLS